MDNEIKLQIILFKPTPGVDFGLQKGSGSTYETVQKQRAVSGNLIFQLAIKVKGDRQKDQFPKFAGDFVQGPTGGKFLYLDIGICAGQPDCIWSRRLKIPLTGINWEDIDTLAANSNLFMETNVPGSAKDGSPNCATVKPFGGWNVKTP